MELLQFSFITEVPSELIGYFSEFEASFICNCYNLFLLYVYFCIFKFVYQVLTTKLKYRLS